MNAQPTCLNCFTPLTIVSEGPDGFVGYCQPCRDKADVVISDNCEHCGQKLRTDFEADYPESRYVLVCRNRLCDSYGEVVRETDGSGFEPTDAQMARFPQ